MWFLSQAAWSGGGGGKASDQSIVKSAVRLTTIGNTGCGMLALIGVQFDSLVSIWQEHLFGPSSGHA